MTACPSKATESGVQCILPDDRHYHGSGHESRWDNNARVSWATTHEEQQRWLEKESGNGRA